MVRKETEILFVSSLREEFESIEFLSRVYRSPELSRDFMVGRVGAQNIATVIREWMCKSGLSTLFNYHVTCDAVMHPGITVDEIENVIIEMLGHLKGVKNLYIIDPYFYSSEPAVLTLFEKMVRELAVALESVTFFTKVHTSARDLTRFDPAAMHAALIKVDPSIRIKDVRTDEFHDRFWIDPDAGKGVVMGTSLNGVMRKIALIDHLRPSDASQLADLARALV